MVYHRGCHLYGNSWCIESYLGKDAAKKPLHWLLLQLATPPAPYGSLRICYLNGCRRIKYYDDHQRRLFMKELIDCFPCPEHAGKS
jgi:hypothetical protein